MSNVSGSTDDSGPTPNVSEFGDKRSRIPSRKGFQSLLIKKTLVFNKETKALQKAIDSVVHTATGEPSTLKSVIASLEVSKYSFERILRDLEDIFAQDRWGEAKEVKSTVSQTSQKFLQTVNAVLLEAAGKLKEAVKDDELSLKESRRGIFSSRSGSSCTSSTNARRKALAEAAAAKKQAEYDLLMAERENARKLTEADEERRRAAARAQHDHDMAVLAAKKLTAVAKAKLDSIEQSILGEEEGSFSFKSREKVDVTSERRTEAWLQNQRQNVTEVSKQAVNRRSGVRFSVERSQNAIETPQQTRSQQRTESTSRQEIAQQPGGIVQQCMGAIAATNEKLTASLARMSLPKCHPDVFYGDATMFHPWKSTFKGMIRDCDVSPEHEMNYLHMYTKAEPQKLVNSFRKRQHHDPIRLLNELWKEMERRFGNVAVITKAFLTRLREYAKFGDKDKAKLLAFSDLCIDVASQIDQLPGLACLNYPNAIQHILQNLPGSLRSEWEKQVVKFAAKNYDAYPDFTVFASMVEKQSLLRNHPNVTAAGDRNEKEKNDRRNPSRQQFHPSHTVLKGNAEMDKEGNDEKHCWFHDSQGHDLTECRAFSRKTLQEKTQWIKQERLCFRCLLPKHVAKECRANVKCKKCGSDRHLVILHLDKKKEKTDDSEKKQSNESEKKEETDDGEEINSARTDIGCDAVGGVSCSKIVLLDIFHPSRPDNKVRVYALIDEQSNASMISPELIDKLGVVGSKEKYLLSTCSGSKEIRFGRRVPGLKITSMKGVSLNLPTMVECDNIPKDKREIPSPELAKRFDHLRDIAGEIPSLDAEAEVQLLIGRNAPELLKVRAFRNGPKGEPWAHKLSIGWTICGQVCLDRHGGPVHILTHRTVCHDLFGEVNDGVRTQRTTGLRLRCNAFGQTLCHELVPCPNNFVIKEAYGKSENSTDVFHTTDRDNESSMSVEDRRFMQIMERGIRKNEKGNWEMPLPLRSSKVSLPNNREQALSRIRSLLHTFRKKPQMEEDYFLFMAKLFERGHAVPVPPNEQPKDEEGGKVWYLPHFGVYHPRKSKIRVVFDSSAHFQGTSLNTELLPGPDTLNSLLGILIRFRRDNVAVVCDIEQMFHSFHVDPSHRDMLRFLWFEDNDGSKEIIEYQMVVHLFGNSSSPAVATFGLRKTAEEGEQEFGRAAKEFVLNDFYVDDGLTSCPTAKEAVNLVKNTQTMLATANLRLHKIASNSVEVMKALPQQDRVDSFRDLDLHKDPLPSQRSLGVIWNLEKDSFAYQISLPEKPYTHRGVLSIINSIYDPLGHAIPVTLQGRLLLRELVTRGNERNGKDPPLGWDDPLPDALQNKWKNWKDSLNDLQDVLIPRCYLPEHFGKVSKIEIHAFSDASCNAIGTAIYLKQTNEAEEVSLSLVYAQARLSPKQATTIPRLELCAAVLSAQAVNWITRELKLGIDETVFYTDSKVVLGYIQNESRRFYVYVANRVQIIRSMSSPLQWRYVETMENPADIATRGKAAKDLRKSSWFNGPDFLRNSSLPVIDPVELPIVNNDPEIRPQVTIYSTDHREIQGLGSSRFDRFSKWVLLRRALANLMVKAKQLKARRKTSSTSENRDARNSPPNFLAKSRQLRLRPSATELKQAETLMIKTVQTDAFTSEMKALQQTTLEGSSSKSSLTKSNIYRLDPFIDDDGVLRVGGRLRRVDQMFEEKHPAILPKNSYLATLVIDHYHNKVYHQGRQITHGAIRQAGIWIMGVSRMISKKIGRCVICRRLRGRNMTQHMADLPADRLDTPPPFTNVGLDVFGPWIIQTRRLRGGAANAKRWALIFTCLNCRGIHIEVLETMETSSFICALRRFISIRGPPSILRCDRGTNFVGGKSELDHALHEMDHKAIANYANEQNCEWLFNPPHASHFGGIWERQIGTVRRVLDAMLLQLGPSQLTHELLVTLMAEVTGIVNSRPIATLPSDVDQPQPLSPNMLLTMKMRPLLSPPGVFTPQDLYSRRYWRRAQYLADQFWTRWKREYLQAQQSRSKWNKQHPNLAVGDIVIMKEDTHRNQWPLGRIVEAVKSEDGKVRKARIAIWKSGQKKCYFRPISELVLIMHL